MWSKHSRRNSRAKFVAIDRVTITDQIMLSVPFRESFDDLLSRPFGGRTLGDPEVKNLPPRMLDHKEHEQHPQIDRWHGEEVNGDNLPDVILEEGLPGLQRRPLDGPQDARNGPFDSEFPRLAVNAWRTPQWICLRQGPNQRADLKADRWSPKCCGPLRQVRPVTGGNAPAANAPPCRDERGTRLAASPSRPGTVRSRTSGPVGLIGDAFAWQFAAGERNLKHDRVMSFSEQPNQSK